MANGNSPYIAKAAGPLVNPTTATPFLQLPSPIATVATTQVLKVAYSCYKGYNDYGTGVSNQSDLVQLIVRAAGRTTYGVAGNFTPSLVIGAPATTNNFLVGSPTTTLFSLTPQAASAAGTGTWQIAVTLFWDPNTGVISGTGTGSETVLVAGAATTTLTANVAITPLTGYIATQPTSVQSNTTVVPIPAANGELALFFAVAGLFSATNANNQALQDVMQTETV